LSVAFIGRMGNESVPKIIINDTIIFFLNCILVVSNNNTFRVLRLFDKIASVYFIIIF